MQPPDFRLQRIDPDIPVALHRYRHVHPKHGGDHHCAASDHRRLRHRPAGVNPADHHLGQRFLLALPEHVCAGGGEQPER